MDKYFLIALFLTGVTQAAQSDLGRIALLAEDSHQIVLNLAPVSVDFKQDQEGSERLQAYANYQDEIAEYINTRSYKGDDDCNKEQFKENEADREALVEKVKKRKITIGLYASYNTGESLMNEVLISPMRNYKSYMRSESQVFGSDYESLVGYFVSNRPEIKKEWATMSSGDRASLMKKYIMDKFKIDIPTSLILREEVIIAAKNDPSSWNKNVSSLKNILSDEEKFQFLSDIGGRFLKHYNNDKANNGEGHATSIDEMFSSLGSESPGGVCRDVVAAQAEIAMALGIKEENIFRVGYQSPNGAHQTLAVIDPEDPSKLHKINYSEWQTDESNKGVSQLKQRGSMAVTGISYRVYDAKGKPVLEMPTELGQALREASGFKSSNDISKSYNINRLFVDTEFGEGAIVTGELSDGTKLAAVTFNDEVLNSVNYGVSAYKTEGQSDNVEILSQGIYSYINTNPSYTYKATDRFSVRANLDMGMEFQANKSTITNNETGVSRDSDTKLESSITFTPGIQTSYTGEKVDIYARAEVDTYLHFKDAHEQKSVGLNVNGVNYKSGISYQMTDSMKTSLDAAVYTRNVGDYYIVKAALEDQKRDFTVEAKYQAPITKNMPSFVPGSYQVSQIEGVKSWKSKNGTGPTIRIGYTEDELVGGRVNLSGSWAFY